jgi:hypothetical protein
VGISDCCTTRATSSTRPAASKPTTSSGICSADRPGRSTRRDGRGRSCLVRDGWPVIPPEPNQRERCGRPALISRQVPRGPRQPYHAL